LAGGVDQLVALRLFERVMLRVAKISAGVLHLIVEKQAIELGGNVVVVAGMSGGELRIDEQLGMELAVVQVNGDVGAGQAISEYVHVSAGVADSQRTQVNETPKQVGQQTHVAVLRKRPSPYNNESGRRHAMPREPSLN